LSCDCRIREKRSIVAKSTVIEVVCAWCGAGLGTKDGGGQEGVSHGICGGCSKRPMKGLKGA